MSGNNYGAIAVNKECSWDHCWVLLFMGSIINDPVNCNTATAFADDTKSCGEI